jgi:hypothetical protein
MAERLDDVLTQVSKEEMFVALWRAWIDAFETTPMRNSILLLIAHWALETGWGKSMHCFNVGNVKSREGDGRDFCFFACGEEVPKATADAWLHAAPSLVHVKRWYVRDEQMLASVWIEPDHAACRFRAFRTLEEGATDYLALLRRRFSTAWPFVCTGDPVGFVRALKQARYFTADAGVYAASVRSIFSKLQTELHVDVSALPVLSAEHAQRVLNLVALTSEELLKEGSSA